MRKTATVIIILISLTGCFLSEKSTPDKNILLTIIYKHGSDLSPVPYKNIYAIWIENRESSFIQNIYICNKLIKGKLTGTALPFWKLNIFPKSKQEEVDAVTAATKSNQDFIISAELKNSSIRKFTIYFEIDRSFDRNEWFNDQPALLYSAEINLDNRDREYVLKPCGWTPNELTENIVAGTTKGILQNDLRYITHKKVKAVLGTTDKINSATFMVNSISLRISQK